MENNWSLEENTDKENRAAVTTNNRDLQNTVPPHTHISVYGGTPMRAGADR